jgi:glyoxylase-like metal-dependent hydrolase (beta-lactamase superfamily II)
VVAVHRLGTRWVNWYVVEDGDGATVIDTGYPGYRAQLPKRDDIRAVVITHAHADHLGSVARIQEETGARVLVHELDADVVRSGSPEPPPRFLADLWRPRFARYVAHAVKNGAMKIRPAEHVETFAEGDVLDVPGRPRVLHTPGHTPGIARCCSRTATCSSPATRS